MTISNLLTDLQVTAATLHSDSDLDGYAVDGVRPMAVVQPATPEEVAALLRLAAARGLAVTARGGGTAIEHANPPERLVLVLDMTRLDRIVEHRPRDLTVTVEAGVTVGALQRTLAGQGQMLALDPPFEERATIGGVLAANTFGPRRQRYGTARDLLIGSRAVLADGTAVRFGGKVVKNVAGYDLNKLLVGSYGTIAVITEATLKVTPLPANFGMLLATFSSIGAAQAVALAVNRSRLQPLTLDLLSPTASKRIAASSGRDFPEGSWLLACEVGGPRSLGERTTNELRLMATGGGATRVAPLDDDQRITFLRRLREFGRSGEDPAALLLRGGVLPSETAHAAQALERATSAAPPALVIHAGSGIVYAAWEEAPAADVPRMVADARAALASLGATVVVERAPAESKAALDIWGITGADVELMRRVKAAYDPNGTLSPGRVV